MSKILYFNLVTYSKTGGIENFNKTFLKALDDLYTNVISVSVYDNQVNDVFKNICFKNFNKNKLKASLYVLRNIRKIDKLIIAHLNLLPIAIIAKIINPKLKIYLTIYGIEVWKRLPLIYRLFLSKITILSISTYTTKMFVKYNNLSEENIFYLPPAINDIDNINDTDNINVNDTDEFNILSVTRLSNSEKLKGIDSVIKTLPLVIKKIPNIKYIVIGKGNDKKRLENLVKKLKLEKYVEFKGFVEDLSPYYKYCDIFILPSKKEGFGIVYLEAMQYKKPCIACNEGGQTDVVIDNKTGYLCKYNDLNCLKEKILDLYENEDKRIKFGENGYKHLLDNFTFEKFKQNLKKILKEA